MCITDFLVRTYKNIHCTNNNNNNNNMTIQAQLGAQPPTAGSPYTCNGFFSVFHLSIFSWHAIFSWCLKSNRVTKVTHSHRMLPTGIGDVPCISMIGDVSCISIIGDVPCISIVSDVPYVSIIGYVPCPSITATHSVFPS